MPIFVGVCVMTLYSAIVFRQRGPEIVDGPPMMGNVPVQVAWIAISAVIVLSLAVLGIVTLTNANVARAVGTPGRAIGSQSQTGSQAIATENKELQVQVIGQEWFFTYRFPDYGGVETTHLELPVGVPVEIHVTSLDVIHSWWAYQLGVKADANQGVDNVFHVTPQEIGSFQVRCAELCGLWHGEMSDSQGKVVSQAEWQSWISDQQAAFKDTIKYLPKYAPFYFAEPLTKGA
jgi:cytochrome c oxidase subunit 2